MSTSNKATTVKSGVLTGPDTVTITFQDGHTAPFSKIAAQALGWVPTGTTPAPKPSVTPGTSADAGTTNTGAGTTNTGAGTNTGNGSGDILNQVVTNNNIGQMIADFRGSTAIQAQVRDLLVHHNGMNAKDAEDSTKLLTAYTGELAAAMAANGGAGQGLTDFINNKNYTNSTLTAALDPADITAKLNDFMNKNNLKYSPAQIQNYTDTISSAKQSITDVEQGIRNSVLVHQYPAWADQIKAGVDISTIAQQYITDLATTLEVDPNTIKLNDPRILKAIQAVDAQGKPTYMPMWQFDQNVVKADPSYQYTKGAWTDMNDKFGSLLAAVGVKASSLNVPSGVGAQDFYRKLLSSAGTAGAPLDDTTWKSMVAAPNVVEAFQILGKSTWYKNEFPGMTAFAASNPGINPLDPQSLIQYKNQEATYRDAAISEGLSPSLYSTAAIGGYMQQNINTEDFKQRAVLAHDMVTTVNPDTLAALQNYHGINKSNLASYYLNPKATVADLTDISKQVQLGGEASHAGVPITGQYALSLAQDAAAGGPFRESTIRTAEDTAGEQKAGIENILSQSGKSQNNDQLIGGALDVGSAAGVAQTQAKSSEAAKFSGSNAGTASTGKDVSGSF